MVRLNWATLPASWGQMVGVSLLAGIGFTVAIFIAGLAYEEAELQVAKTGILLAAVVAALAGYAVLRLAARRAEASPRGVRER